MDPKIYSVKPGKEVHDRLGYEVHFSGQLCGMYVFKVGDPARDALLTSGEFDSLSATGWEIAEKKPKAKAADKEK